MADLFPHDGELSDDRLASNDNGGLPIETAERAPPFWQLHNKIEK
jgi:hypothetical protein